MSNTVELKHCPKCNTPIPVGAPKGLCPKCVLLGAAAATEAGAPATATSEIPTFERVAAAFPQLEIIELIGRGGMGFVFKARQPHLDRWVALKLLPDKLARDPRFTERFNREGRVLARLNHPNIVSVYDFGVTEDFCFLLMEYVDGVNLRQAMQAGRFSPSEALGIVPKICAALQYAHEQGILHRDIKPENILLDASGQVKIVDFGIAKLVGEEKSDLTLTATGTALGTPHYMAPEQLEKPSEVDHRADIYSLGVVFYEMLTGELPIGRFAAPSSKTPVGAKVDQVVFRTLEKDRERRFQSAGEMKTHVEDLGLGEADEAAATPASTRRGVLKWVLIVLLLVGMGTMMVVWPTYRPASRITPQKVTRTIDANIDTIGFTFTAVESRELAGARWLAIDYLDDVRGQSVKAFPWKTTIPGFKAEVRTSEFLGDAKDSAPVRHQRVEYRMPDSVQRDQIEELRGKVENALLHKSIRLGPGEQKLLFEFATSESASFKAWIKVMLVPAATAKEP